MVRENDRRGFRSHIVRGRVIVVSQRCVYAARRHPVRKTINREVAVRLRLRDMSHI